MVNIKVVAGIAAAALALGLVTGSALAGDDGSETADSAGGVLVSDRSEEGAATAAARYSQAIGEALLSGESTRRQLIQMLSTEDSFDEILEAQLAEYEALDEAFDLSSSNTGVVARNAALGYRVLGFGEQRAEVEVWSVSIGGKLGVGSGPSAAFSTTRTALAWEEGAWRLSEQPVTDDGPTPSLIGTPSPPERLVSVARDYRRFDHAAK